MISVLKENTRGLTHVNRKQMWKIIEEKGLTDKAFEIEKGVKRKVDSGRIAIKKPVRAVDLDSLKETIFPSIEEGQSILVNQKHSLFSKEGFLKIISFNESKNTKKEFPLSFTREGFLFD